MHIPNGLVSWLYKKPVCRGHGAWLLQIIKSCKIIKKMVKAWEEHGPEYFSAIQKDLILKAAAMLKPGGRMLYYREAYLAYNKPCRHRPLKDFCQNPASHPQEKSEVPLEAPYWQLVCVDGYPLGWGKLSGGTLKNKYLPGWRLV